MENDGREIISKEEHKKLHKQGIAHVHIDDYGYVDVKIKADANEPLKEEVHNHSHIDGDRHHIHDHNTGHHHDPVHMKKIENRMSRAIGHMEHIKKMVANEVDCSQVLIQLSAVKSAVNNIAREILKEHLAHCMKESIEHGDTDAIATLESAIDQFMK